MRFTIALGVGLALLTASGASADRLKKVKVVNLPEVQEVTGAVEVTNLPEVQEVTGAIEVINLPDVQAVEIVNPVTPTPMRFQLVGYTQATYQGDATPFGLTRACQAEFPESRLCSSVEIMETVDPDAAVGLANGPAWTQPSYAYSTGSIAFDASGRRLGNTIQSNCSHWTSAGHGLTVDENGVTRLIACSSSLAVACCGIRP